MIVGIDLGTTNSLITYFKDNETHIIKNEFGNEKTPSVVSFDSDGTYYVGDIAKERQITHSDSTFSVFKRELGSETQYYAYGRVNLTPLDLSVLVIKYLIKQAEDYLNEPVTETVISVPAYFTDVQRHETKMAGIMAGIKVERIINEPSSAALAYYHKYQQEGYSLIFDFGGGTLDISLVDIFNDIVDVIAVVGDMKLGGVDIDDILAKDFIDRHLKFESLYDTDIRNITLEAEKVKIKLNTSNNVRFGYIHNGVEYETYYSNEILTELSASLLSRIKELIETILMDSQIDKDDLESIICVGGSSNVLYVRRYLEYLLDIKPTISINSEVVVALGVGIVSAIKARNPDVRDMLITDVCPFSIGVGMVENRFGIIIPKNSVLPVVKEEYYVTVNDNQKSIGFQIYQGDSPVASDNKPIGNLEQLEVTKNKAPAGTVGAWVKIAYDINGILNVSYRSNVEVKEKVLITNPNLDTNIVSRQLEKLKKLESKKEENPLLTKVRFRYDSIYRNSSFDIKVKLEESYKEFQHLIAKDKPSITQRALIQFDRYLNRFNILDEKENDFVFKFEEDDSLLN